MCTVLSLYPAPQLIPVSTLKDLLSIQQLPSQEALAAQNANDLFASLPKRQLQMSVASLEPICKLVTQIPTNCHPFKMSKKEHPAFAHSFFVHTRGEDRIVDIALQRGRIHPPPEVPTQATTLRITAVVRVVFGADGRVKTVLDRVKHFGQQNDECLRRLSIMQELNAEHYPTNDSFFAYQGKKGEKVCVIQERAEKDLFAFFEETDEFQTMPYAQRLQAARSCLLAVKTAHDKGYAHLDIKLENFLVFASTNASVIKLSDFEYMRKVADQMKKINCGSLPWAAPEILMQKQSALHDQMDGRLCDIWSLGLLLHLLSGELPSYIHPLCHAQDCIDGLKVLEREKVYSKALQVKIDTLEKQRQAHMLKWSKKVVGASGKPSQICSLRDIAQSMLQYDPRQRMNLQDALTALDRLISAP